MNINELYLKTVFCCMACDGEIAKEEVDLIRTHCKNSDLYEGISVENLLNDWIKQINENSAAFLAKYLNNLASNDLSEEQELTIVKLAMETIEADNEILYSEVKFFKRIRAKLNVSDELILNQHPDKDYYLEQDINDDYLFDDIILENIQFNLS